MSMMLLMVLVLMVRLPWTHGHDLAQAETMSVARIASATSMPLSPFDRLLSLTLPLFFYRSLSSRLSLWLPFVLRGGLSPSHPPRGVHLGSVCLLVGDLLKGSRRCLLGIRSGVAISLVGETWDARSHSGTQGDGYLGCGTRSIFFCLSPRRGDDGGLQRGGVSSERGEGGHCERRGCHARR